MKHLIALFSALLCSSLVQASPSFFAALEGKSSGEKRRLLEKRLKFISSHQNVNLEIAKSLKYYLSLNMPIAKKNLFLKKLIASERKDLSSLAFQYYFNSDKKYNSIDKVLAFGKQTLSKSHNHTYSTVLKALRGENYIDDIILNSATFEKIILKAIPEGDRLALNSSYIYSFKAGLYKLSRDLYKKIPNSHKKNGGVQITNCLLLNALGQFGKSKNCFQNLSGSLAKLGEVFTDAVKEKETERYKAVFLKIADKISIKEKNALGLIFIAFEVFFTGKLSKNSLVRISETKPDYKLTFCLLAFNKKAKIIPRKTSKKLMSLYYRAFPDWKLTNALSANNINLAKVMFGENSIIYQVANKSLGGAKKFH